MFSFCVLLFAGNKFDFKLMSPSNKRRSRITKNLINAEAFNRTNAALPKSAMASLVNGRHGHGAKLLTESLVKVKVLWI